MVPASQGNQPANREGSVGSPEADSVQYAGNEAEPIPHDHRGSVNADGSINLGFRNRKESHRGILPDPTVGLQSGQQHQPGSNDLTAYASTNQSHASILSEQTSMTAENTLPPINTYHGLRQTSLSPNPYQSPRRKRSFEAERGQDSSDTKRLSSIKSILNPSGDDQHRASEAGYRSAPTRSPHPPYMGMPSPNYTPDSRHRSPNMSSSNTIVSKDNGDNERAKLERRAALQREAEKMREMLAAKERELEELNK